MVAVSDRRRTLRARRVMSAPPVTRSAATPPLLSVSNNRTASQHAEALHHPTAKTYKGASKRAAALDNSSSCSRTVHAQQDTFWRRYTRGDERKFREACAEEALKNRSLPRVLQLFGRVRGHEWVLLPGASLHVDDLMMRLYHGACYGARLYQNLKNLSVTLIFGQILTTIIQTETLEEACQRAGTILNESIRSFIEVDRLYALPNPELNFYTTGCWSGYQIFEAAVRVDIEKATQLCMEDLQEIVE